MSEEVKEKQENKRKIPLLSESILLAVLTAIGYAIAYYYEKGYKGYFLMPEDYIELNPTMIIRVIGLTFALWILTFLLINNLAIVFRQLSEKYPIIGFKLDNFLSISLTMVFFMSMQGLNLIGLIMLGIGLLVIAIYMFVLPVLMYRKISGYNEKLRASIKTDDENDHFEKSIIHQVITKIGYRNYRIILGFLFVIALIPNFALMGESRAANQSVYLVIEGKPNFVVLGTYKDYAVIAELDTKKKELIPNYKLIKNEKFNAKLYDVGKLKVAEPETLK